MPFQKQHNTQQKTIIKNKNSLQRLHKLSSPNDKKKRMIDTERVSSFTYLRGSLTVEAALVLPLFLFIIFFMMFFTEVVRVQAVIGNELYKQSKELALYSYVYEQAQSSGIIGSGKVEGIIAGGLSDLYVSSKVEKELGNDYIKKSHIKGGINLLMSSYLQEEEAIDIVAIYKIEIPSNFFQVKPLRIIQRARVRAWTGYDKKEESSQEDIVYITKNGSVYHKDVTCSHINLSVSQVNINGLGKLRNDGGGKYYPCELCEDEPDKESVYITNTGNRYHKLRDCGGITREVVAVPISKVGSRSACSRCGN